MRYIGLHKSVVLSEQLLNGKYVSKIVGQYLYQIKWYPNSSK